MWTIEFEQVISSGSNDPQFRAYLRIKNAEVPVASMSHTELEQLHIVTGMALAAWKKAIEK